MPAPSKQLDIDGQEVEPTRAYEQPEQRHEQDKLFEPVETFPGQLELEGGNDGEG